MADVTLQTLNQQQRLQKWIQRVADCRSSGMRVEAWCFANGVARNTYYRWQRIVFDFLANQNKPMPELKKREQSSPTFAALPEPPAYSRSGAAAATIHLADYSIDIYDGTSEETLQTILRVLRHAE